MTDNNNNNNTKDGRIFLIDNKDILEGAKQLLESPDYALMLAKQGHEIKQPCYVLVNKVTGVIEHECTVLASGIGSLMECQIAKDKEVRNYEKYFKEGVELSTETLSKFLGVEVARLQDMLDGRPPAPESHLSVVKPDKPQQPH